jgi:hypothetical protein
VVVDEQRGFSVAEVSLAELKDLTLARTALESVMLPLAMAQGDDDWEARIVAALTGSAAPPCPPVPTPAKPPANGSCATATFMRLLWPAVARPG